MTLRISVLTALFLFALPIYAKNPVVEKTGTFVKWYEDSKQGATLHYSLVSGQETTELQLTRTPGDLKTGTRISVWGSKTHDGFLVTKIATLASPAAATSALGEQKSIVLFVNLNGTAVDRATIEPFFLGPNTEGSLNDFIQKESFQQASVSADIFGPYDVSYRKCNLVKMVQKAQTVASQANPEIDWSKYQHIVVVTPAVGKKCKFSGMSTVGGAPSNSWIKWYTDQTDGFNLGTITHEFGHTLGLEHAHGLFCRNMVRTKCHWTEYGDLVDVMADPPQSGHYNIFEKNIMGWLGNPSVAQIQTVTQTGIYKIEPADLLATTGLPKGLRVVVGKEPVVGRKSSYYLEFNNNEWYDQSIQSDQGLQVRLADDSRNFGTFFVDETRVNQFYGTDTSIFLDSNVQFNFDHTGLVFELVSIDATGATISVTYP